MSKFGFVTWLDTIYLGPLFINWEPWCMRIGLTFGPWMVFVQLRGAFTKAAKQRRRELKAQGKWKEFNHWNVYSSDSYCPCSYSRNNHKHRQACIGEAASWRRVGGFANEFMAKEEAASKGGRSRALAVSLIAEFIVCDKFVKGCSPFFFLHLPNTMNTSCIFSLSIIPVPSPSQLSWQHSHNNTQLLSFRLCIWLLDV